MKAEDLKLEELMRFSEGNLEIHGQKLIIHDLYAIGQLQLDLVNMVGIDEARRIITRFGYFCGQNDSSTMQRIFNWDTIEDLTKAGFILQQLKGGGNSEINKLSIDENEGKFYSEVVWHDSEVAKANISELGSTDYPACWLIVGYLSGYITNCIGKSVYFMETKCITKGDSHCIAIGKDVDSWGHEITPHIDYFRITDIQSKIKELSSKLINVEKKIIIRNKLLKNALEGSSLSSIEMPSLQFKYILDIAKKVAKFDSSILISGETGVGKELLASHIHKTSPRSNGPFIAVNCSALPDTLLESELFGYKKGSFTGAIKDKQGLFEAANNGVIFLDEIGDISPNMQLKLLRVIQEREILRIGDTKPIKLDIRFISATNRNLEEEMSKGNFREDLYYRLQVIHIEIPPLRDRTEDILPLSRNFINKYSEKLKLTNLTLDSTCIDYLLKYPWPGNIRELEHAIEHAAIFCKSNIILPENLPPKIIQKYEKNEASSYTGLSLQEIELDHIQSVLEITKGNREEAARILGIGAATLYRKLAKIKANKNQA